METIANAREKLREAMVAELKWQAANDPQSLGVESSDGLVVGRLVAMVIAGAVAGGP
jgi:hypothetical protein